MEKTARWKKPIAARHEFRIDRQYLAHGMRWRAPEILMRELGRRSERDLSAEWAVDVGREVFTEIDPRPRPHEARAHRLHRPARGEPHFNRS